MSTSSRPVGHRRGELPADLPREEYVTRGREAVMRQLAMMDRSRYQLEATLKRKAIPEDVTEEILEYFESIGLIDDAHFAAVLTRTRFAGKKASRRAIKEELRRKGVAPGLAEEAVSVIEPEEELQAAITLAKKKLSQASGKPETLYRRTYGTLARRGFSPGQCSKAIREAQAELSNIDDV